MTRRGAGRMAARGMLALARGPALWRDEPRRSAWTAPAMAALLTRHGFRVTADEDTLTIARRLPMTDPAAPLAGQRPGRDRRASEADRQAGVVLGQAGGAGLGWR